MKKYQYEELVLRIVLYVEPNILATSAEDAADDFGGWNDDWFTSNEG